MGFWTNITSKIGFGKDQTMIDRASRGVVRNHWNAVSYAPSGHPAPSKFEILRQLYQKDPVVHTGINARVNAIIASGFTINGKSDRGLLDAQRAFKRIGFNHTFLEKFYKNALLYRHVFMEMVKTPSGFVEEVHILETPQMRIEYDKHGEISKFIQHAEDGQVIEWNPDEIVYAKFDSLSTEMWGETGLSTLFRTLTAKHNIEEFINSLAATNAWRTVFVTKSMTDEDTLDFMAYYRKAQGDPTLPFVMKIPNNSPNMDDNIFRTMRDPAELKEFLGVLEYFRTQILMELQIPPIIVGLPDDSNRSNSEAQMKAYHIANESERKKGAEFFNLQLLPALGFSQIEFSWNPIDKRSEKDDIEIAEKLMNMGAKPKMVEKFLRDAGLKLPEGKLFDEKKINAMKTPDTAASRPSRQREDKAGDIQNKGTGSDSSTRDNQL